jgi:anaerobic selenocysteine-containing dehydrogenase
LSGWRNEDGTGDGRGNPNPNQIQKYIENGGFWISHIPQEAQFFKPWNQAYQDWAVEKGIFDAPAPYVFNLYLEPMRLMQRAAEGHGEIQPPDHLRERIKTTLTPLPVWYEPFEETLVDPDAFPLHALTQRPMHMYHSWGSQNAWLRQITNANKLFVPGKVFDAQRLGETGWAYLTSAHGRIKVPVARMDALNENTVWTWNAIGKKRGAWALSDDAPEVTDGFLLNHLINELLPPKGDGRRWANSDPVTGQAAWFDLRVRIEQAPAGGPSEPQAPKSAAHIPPGPKDIAYGEEF